MNSIKYSYYFFCLNEYQTSPTILINRACAQYVLTILWLQILHDIKSLGNAEYFKECFSIVTEIFFQTSDTSSPSFDICVW